MSEAREAAYAEALQECQRLAIERIQNADSAVKKDIYAADALMGIATIARRTLADISPAAVSLLAERYLPFPCPNCNRVRLLYEPQSGAIRCEKCLADTETLVSFQEALLARAALAPGEKA